VERADRGVGPAGDIAVADIPRRRLLGQTGWPADRKVIPVGFAKEKSRLVVVPDRAVARTFDLP